MTGSEAELRAQVDQLRRELAAMRVHCIGLEQQQAQLATLLAIVAPRVARAGLTRFPLGAALPDKLPIQGQE
jgi:hypothetical protein